MSFIPDWDAICKILWWVITIHWTLIFAGHHENKGTRYNPIYTQALLWPGLIAFLFGAVLYGCSVYFEWPQGANYIIFICAIIGTIIPPTWEAAGENYPELWKRIGPTIMQDWTMALPVVASIFLFWM